MESLFGGLVEREIQVKVVEISVAYDAGARKEYGTVASTRMSLTPARWSSNFTR